MQTVLSQDGGRPRNTLSESQIELSVSVRLKHVRGKEDAINEDVALVL